MEESEKINETMVKTNEPIQRKDIEGTPFSMIVCKDDIKIALGNEIIITKTFKNEEEAKNYVYGQTEMPWELILNATTCFMQYIIEQQNIKEN